MGLIDRLNELENNTSPDPSFTAEARAAGSVAPPPVPGAVTTEQVKAPVPNLSGLAKPRNEFARPTTEAAAFDEPLPTFKVDRRGPDRPSQVEWERMKQMVRAMVREDLAPVLSSLSSGEIETEVRKVLNQIIEREELRITPVQRRAFVQQVMSDTLGLGPLDELLDDPDVTEIMCNRFSEIWVERDGKIEMSDTTFSNDEQYRSVIDRIVSGVGRRIDEASPMVDARLKDGSRVNVVIPPLALDGPALTIRKFPGDPLTAEELVERGIYTPGFAIFIEAAVRAKMNILVSGGTGSGKTTTLNIMSSFIPAGERIVTIEDSAELQLQQPHIVRLESRPANTEGSGTVTIRELVRNSLRMRPDRIVVGECRAGEALDMLQAMNTGHNGSMTTLHSNSSRDAVKRLETMVLMSGFELPIKAVRDQISSALNILVHVERLTTGERIVKNVAEVQGVDGDTILIQDIMVHRNGHLRSTGLRPRVADLIEAQSGPLPGALFRAGATLMPDGEVS